MQQQKIKKKKKIKNHIVLALSFELISRALLAEQTNSTIMQYTIYVRVRVTNT
jgi:hypothetical protein